LRFACEPDYTSADIKDKNGSKLLYINLKEKEKNAVVEKIGKNYVIAKRAV